ncbi:MAG: c-type cytochrome [Alphaproteobacteria bacterium]|nr:c-type cytochrome [Alphaproteobacteria bacterium]
MRGGLTLLHSWTVLLVLPLVSACTQQSTQTAARQIGNASRGAGLISWYGCSACHSVPGVPGADALVGPPLDHFSHRGYIAGVLHNSPDNLVMWIRNPQKFVPGNAMPALGIDDRDAHDIAAYLYSIE